MAVYLKEESACRVENSLSLCLVASKPLKVSLGREHQLTRVSSNESLISRVLSSSGQSAFAPLKAAALCTVLLSSFLNPATQSNAQEIELLSAPTPRVEVAPEGFSLVYAGFNIQDVSSLTYTVSAGLIDTPFLPFYYDRRNITVTGSNIVSQGNSFTLTVSEETNLSEIIDDVAPSFIFQPLRGSKAEVSATITATDSAGNQQTKTMKLAPSAQGLIASLPTSITAAANGEASLDLRGMRFTDESDRTATMTLLFEQRQETETPPLFTVSNFATHGLSCMTFFEAGEADCTGSAALVQLVGKPSQFKNFFAEPNNIRWQYPVENKGDLIVGVGYFLGDEGILGPESMQLRLPVTSTRTVALERLGRDEIPASLNSIRVGSTQWFKAAGITAPYQASVSPASLGKARVINNQIAVNALSEGEGELRLTAADGVEHTFVLSFENIGSVSSLGVTSADSTDATVFEGGISRDFGKTFDKAGIYYPNDELYIYFQVRPDESYVGLAAGLIIAATNSAEPNVIYVLAADGSLTPYQGGEFAYFSQAVLKEVNEIDVSAAFPYVVGADPEGEWSLFAGFQLPDGRLIHSAEAVQLRF